MAMTGGLTLSHIPVPAGTRASGIEFDHAVFTVRLSRAWGRSHPVQFNSFPISGVEGPKWAEIFRSTGKKTYLGGKNYSEAENGHQSWPSQ